jgi:predicted ATP-grasp superfamily ATP-dependent carboligase
VPLPETIEANMLAAAEKLCAALPLAGLVSFDFLLVGEQPHLLEVNPRPGATLDVFDDAMGMLFHAHMAASRGLSAPLPNLAGSRSAAILYADAGPLVVPPVAWPSWTADRPHAGTRIPRGRPIATVMAGADTPEGAFNCCRTRLDELGQMLYAQAPNRERHDNGEIQRPRTERFGARRQAG